MTDIEAITQKLVDFRNEREWQQFHNPKDLAAALSIEASELLECFLWKEAKAGNENRIKEELADVFAYAFLMAEHYGFDVKEIVEEKIVKNGDKYPVEKSKGTATKYFDL